MKRKSTIHQHQNEQDSLLQDSQLKLFLNRDKDKNNMLSARSSKSMSIISPMLQYDSRNLDSQKKMRKALYQQNLSKNNNEISNKVIFKNQKNLEFEYIKNNKYTSFSAMKMHFSRPKNVISPLNSYKRLSVNISKLNSNTTNNSLNKNNSNNRYQRKTNLNQNITASNSNTLHIKKMFQNKLNLNQNQNQNSSRNNQNKELKNTIIANEQKLRSQLKSACHLDRRVDQVIHNAINKNQFKKAWIKNHNHIHQNKNLLRMRLNSSNASIDSSINNSTIYKNNNDNNLRRYSQSHNQQRNQIIKRQKLSKFTMKPKSVWQNQQNFKKKHFIQNPFKQSLGQSQYFNQKHQLIDIL